MIKKDSLNDDKIKALETGISDDEKDLRLKIRRGQTEDALRVFDDLFSNICVVHHDNIPMIKGRILELLVWLSRSVADIGAHDEDYHFHNTLIYEELYNFSDTKTIRRWMTKVIVHFTEIVKESEKDNTLQAVYAVSEYIQNHFKEKVTIEDIAASVHLNGSYTSHLFRKTFGYTITDYLTYVRLENAKIVLADPTSNINDAAVESGFSDVSYFSRVFKKIEGISPREYKNKLK
jgi:two-component system response regulator YesN